LMLEIHVYKPSEHPQAVKEPVSWDPAGAM